MADPTKRLIDNLQLRLPGALLGFLELELFNVIDEFCRSTGAWLEQNPVTLIAGQQYYDVTPVGTEIVEMIEVQHATLDLTGLSYDSGNLLLATPPVAADVTAGMLYVKCRLTPTTGDDITPNSDRTQWLPVDMWPTYHELLLDGVLARMMSQIAKPYSSPVMATYHGKRFRNAMAQARANIAHNGVAGAPTWSFPRGFR